MYSLCLIALIATETPGALTLAEAVERAVASDPRIARATVLRERAALTSLRARLDRFSVRVDARVEELLQASSRSETPRSALGRADVSAQLDVPLFAGFGIEASVDRADALERASAYDILDERRATALAVSRAYWAARKLALIAEVDRRALDRIQSAEAIARARVDSGLAPPIDESRARARRLRQESDLVDLMGAIGEAHSLLTVLLGASEPVTPSDPPRTPRPPPALLDQTYGARPELRAALLRIDAQRHAIIVARSSYFPRLSAYGAVRLDNEPVTTASPFRNLEADAGLGVRLSVNLFDTLRTHTAIEDAAYEVERLIRESDELRRDVEREVRRAHARMSRYYRVHASLEPLYDVAQDNVALLYKRYESGEAQVFELLDAEIELVEVERRQMDAQSELTLAGIELDIATGAVFSGERQ